MWKKTFGYKSYDSMAGSLAAPINLSVLWNFGSLLGIFYILQILSGVFLATFYLFSVESGYVNMLTGETPKIITRYIHANGASFLFFFLYMHIARGLYFSSYVKMHTWNIGVSIFLVMMLVAFMGYVLPGNQMSYWGASVITGLISEVPYLGVDVLKLLWGGYGVEEPLYLRFFSFHYLLPFVVAGLVVIHIILLHTDGSSNPMGQKSYSILKFHKYYSWIDLLFVVIMLATLILSSTYGLSAWDFDVFANASSSITPHHIQPEWYFLFAYAILRAIPNKLGGVIALVLSIMILYSLSFMFNGKSTSMNFYSTNKILYWFFVYAVLILTWIGFSPAEAPYTQLSWYFMLFYFSYFYFLHLSMQITDYYIL